MNNNKPLSIAVLLAHLFFATIFMLQAQETLPPEGLAPTNPPSVGVIPGTIDVSPMGAATYTIPIEVVPGTQGVQPNLSIVYNSMSGMGLLGMKWNLTGLSAITRCGENLYFDDDITAIDFSFASHTFALDGERLIKLQTINNNGIQREFATEQENFSRIYSHGPAGRYSPTHFTVYTDDGTIVEYGNSEDSKHKLQDGDRIGTLSWYINKITDANGNYMTYEYENFGNEKVIKQISYTQNNQVSSMLQPFAKVKFGYRDLPDNLGKNTCFVSGYDIPQTKLLETITVYYGNDPVRQYQFKYNNNDPDERTIHLKEVILYGEGGREHLNETKIEWNEQDNGFQVDKPTYSSIPKGNILTGDFNGDGYTDYVIYGQGTDKNIWKLYTGSGTGTFLPTGIEGTHKGLDTLPNGPWCFFYRADITGDGCDDLIIEERDYPTVFRILSIKNEVTEIARKEINDFNQILFGDFDGNETTDILFVGGDPFFLEYSSVYTKFYSYSGLNVSLRFPNTKSLPIVSVGDFTGAGKTDIRAHYSDGNSYVYTYNNITKQFDLFQSQVDGYGPCTFTGDFNGDGITDFLTFDKDNNWQLRFGGSNFDPTSIPELLKAGEYICLGYPYHSAFIPYYKTIVADVNGDGKDDIVQIQPDVAGKIKIFYSKGCIDGHYQYEFIEEVDGNLWYDIKNVCIADFNNDGILDIIAQEDTDLRPNISIFYFNKSKQYEYVKKITDGIGKTIRINYKNKTIIAKSEYWNSNFPTRYKRYSASIIESIKISNGIGNEFNTFEYQYDNTVYSLPRKTFLGFNKFICINNQENKKKTSIFAVENSKQIMKPVSQTTYYNNISRYETIYNYVFKDLNTFRYVPYSNETTVKDILSDTKTVTTTTLKTDGRVESTKTLTYNTSSASNWLHSKTNTYSYETITLNGKQKKTVPIQILTTQQYGSNSLILTDTITYNYYTSTTNKGRLEWERKGNPDGSITTSYSNYLPSGLCQQKTVSAQGCSARSETYTYDATQRFTTSVKNAHFHEMKFEYNLKTGNKTKETDPNGLITKYDYDAFGNLTLITYPDNTKTTTSVEWYSNSSLPNAKYSVTTKTDATPDVTVYYDILGREVCRKADGYYYETQYNDKGQVVKTSYPFGVFGENIIWRTYTYDEYGRKQTEIAPYTNLSFTYSNRKITVTDHSRNDNMSTKNYDALGRIVEATDEGGTITYNYDVITESRKTRHQTKISVPGSGTTTIVSDLWGNRLSILEPNATKVGSTYNGFNELVTQTDGNANVTTFKYDMLGRITQKTFTDCYNKSQTVKYVYDCARNGKGKISEIKLDDKFSETFKYDYLSRMSESQKLIDNMAHKLNYSYNDKSQLSQLIYDDSFAVNYTYTSAGKLNEIRRADNSNALIYKVNSRNKYNLPTYCTYGNGVATQCEYNPYGIITRIQTGKENSSSYGGGGGPLPKGGIEGKVTWVDSTILNYRYAYNTKGLMVSRSESVVNRLEEYEYDDLERLTKITAGSIGQTGTPQILSYKTNGNIDNNSTVGQYVYGSKPHAVSKITPINNNVISANRSDVSYNFFNQPTQIIEEDASTPGGYQQIELFYGANQQRNKMIQKKEEDWVSTQYYMSKYHERKIDSTGHISYYDYIYGDNGVVALHIHSCVYTPDTINPPNDTVWWGTDEPIQWQRGAEGTDSLYYIHTDHLGSYCAITNANKQVRQHNYFDPWGNIRKLTRGSLPHEEPQVQELATINFALTARGFTGHEHYPYFKIINMNGRLYDPVIGRFFSPDNFVQAPYFTQSYNRYSYAFNNPLKYVDPSGEFGLCFGSLEGWSEFFKIISNLFTSLKDWKDPSTRPIDPQGSYYLGTLPPVIIPETSGNGPGNWKADFPLQGISGAPTFNSYTPVGGFPVHLCDNTAYHRPAAMPPPPLSKNPTNNPSDIGNTISNLLANLEFAYNITVDGSPYASNVAQGFGAGLTGLSFIADMNQIRNQYNNGGRNNVNPFTAARAGTNFVGLASKISLRLGFGGSLMPYIGRTAGFVGVGITTAQSWWMIYEKMDALRFAPLYLDKTTGDPYYGDPIDEYYYYKSIDEWR